MKGVGVNGMMNTDACLQVRTKTLEDNTDLTSKESTNC